MSNTFNPSDLVSTQMVQSLHAKGNLINTVNTDYSADFTQKGYVPGQTVTIDIEHQPTITSGRVASVQDVVNRTTSVTLGQFNGAFELTSIESRYDIDQWRRYADSIAMRLMREMEIDGFNFALENIGNEVGTPGVEPGALKTWAEGRAKISDALGPMRNCYGAISPLANVSLTDSLKNAQNPANTISNQYLTSRMKEGAGINFYESPSVARQTSGTQDNTTPVTNGAGQTGASLILDGLDNNATVTKGTHFTIGTVFAVDPETKVKLSYLKEFAVTTDATADGSGDVTLAISPPIFDSTSPHQNVNITVPDGATITFKNVSSDTARANLIYDRDALSLVSVPLPAPLGDNNAKMSFKAYNGVQIRVGVGAWDAIGDKQILRVDAVWAWAKLREDHACIVWGE